MSFWGFFSIMFSKKHNGFTCKVDILCYWEHFRWMCWFLAGFSVMCVLWKFEFQLWRFSLIIEVILSLGSVEQGNCSTQGRLNLVFCLTVLCISHFYPFLGSGRREGKNIWFFEICRETNLFLLLATFYGRILLCVHLIINVWMNYMLVNKRVILSEIGKTHRLWDIL